MDHVNTEALVALCPARKASQGITVAVFACLPPQRVQNEAAQVRSGGRVSGWSVGRGVGRQAVGSPGGCLRVRATLGKPWRVSQNKGGELPLGGAQEAGLGVPCTVDFKRKGRGKRRSLGRIRSPGSSRRG
ncbi:hypothetical protein NDU88_009924 [Pleurodeles waltl]|uniref:Uncharacterized protein n=1 Tax=Pleurodeles waltl TaxID=8319 RepID=A0AAV7RY04_PLEWA|nr:hypothetical protein NDU88_009924 [Pleurodeles waltl]